MSLQSPPPNRFPTGWFHVCDSRDVKRGQVLPLTRFDRELVVFRSESGEIGVLDAHCPHMGAHLGHGGTVVGDCLRCPFHATGFDRHGAAHVGHPALKPLENSLHAHPWPVREVQGMVFVFHDPAHAAQPLWDFPDVPEFAEKDPWITFRRKTWTTRATPRDLVENSTDILHFISVHRFNGGRVRDVVLDGPRFRYVIELELEFPLFGKLDTVAEVEYYGLGLIMFRPREAKTRFRFLSTVTMLSPTHLTETSYLLVKRSDYVKDYVRNLVQFHLNCRSIEEDFRIFEHRAPVERAPADETERAILAWYDRFFEPAPKALARLTA